MKMNNQNKRNCLNEIMKRYLSYVIIASTSLMIGGCDVALDDLLGKLPAEPDATEPEPAEPACSYSRDLGHILKENAQFIGTVHSSKGGACDELCEDVITDAQLNWINTHHTNYRHRSNNDRNNNNNGVTKPKISLALHEKADPPENCSGSQCERIVYTKKSLCKTNYLQFGKIDRSNFPLGIFKGLGGLRDIALFDNVCDLSSASIANFFRSLGSLSVHTKNSQFIISVKRIADGTGETSSVIVNIDHSGDNTRLLQVRLSCPVGSSGLADLEPAGPDRSLSDPNADNSEEEGEETETAGPNADNSQEEGEEPETAAPNADNSEEEGEEPETADPNADNSEEGEEPETAGPNADNSEEEGEEPETAGPNADNSEEEGEEPETAGPNADNSEEEGEEPETAGPSPNPGEPVRAKGGELRNMVRMSVAVPEIVSQIDVSEGIGGYSDLVNKGHNLMASVVKKLQTNEAHLALPVYFTYKVSASSKFRWSAERQPSNFQDETAEEYVAMFELHDFQEKIRALVNNPLDNKTYLSIQEHRNRESYANWRDLLQYYVYLGDYVYNESDVTGYTDQLHIQHMSNALIGHMKAVVNSVSRFTEFTRKVPEEHRQKRKYPWSNREIPLVYGGLGGIVFQPIGDWRMHWHKNGLRFRFTWDSPYCDTEKSGYHEDIKVRGDGKQDLASYHDLSKKYMILTWDCNSVVDDEVKNYKYYFVMRNVDHSEAVAAEWDGLYVRAHLQSYPGLLTKEDNAMIVNAYFSDSRGGFIHFRRKNVYLKLASDGSLIYGQEGKRGLSREDRAAFTTIHKVFQGRASFSDGHFAKK